MFEPQQAEEYFSTINSPSRRLIQDINEIRNSAMTESETQNWDALSDHMKDKILDERLIDNLNGCSRPRPQKYHTLDRHSRRRARDNKIQSTLPNGKASVRLSTFGVEQVFPRLKIDAGQKEVTVEDTSNGFHTDDSSDNIKTVTYRDEHSAPFNWATKSQQELRFEAGTPEDKPNGSEASEQSLETLRTMSPKSSTLSIRQSRGNPCFAKRVQIPQVPNISTKASNGVSATLGRKVKQPSVSPHRINNFVCETSPNRLILDFGNSKNETENSSEHGSDFSGPSTGHNSSTECSTTRSTVGLLEKMKLKTKTSIKRSISSVSNKNRMKKDTSRTSDSKLELSNCHPNSKEFINYKYSPTNSSLTLSSISITNNSMTSLQSSQTLISSAHQYSNTSNSIRASRQSSRQSSVISCDKIDLLSNNSKNKEPIYGTTRRNITKPSHAPPPPPTKSTKPSFNPPPPPLSSGSSIKVSVPYVTPPAPAISNSTAFEESVPYITPVLPEIEESSSESPKQSSLRAPIAVKEKVDIEEEVVSNQLSATTGDLIIPCKIDPATKDNEIQNAETETNNDSIEPLKSLDDFKIDLHVDLEMPKTGFDFLDNW